MSGEENAGKQPDRPKGRSMPVFTAVVAFSLGVMAQRSGAVDEFAEVVQDIPRPDFDECVDRLLSSSRAADGTEVKSLYSRQVDSVRVQYWNVPMLDPDAIAAESVVAVCNSYADQDAEVQKRNFVKAKKNRAKSEYRKHWRVTPFDEWGDLAADDSYDPEVTVARQERLRLFEECCERLNLFERAVVDAHIRHGVPWSAIGARAGKPMSERKARREFNAAMEKLKNICPGLTDAF